MRANWKETICSVPYCRAFTWGNTRVICGQEPGIGWHLSISCPMRYPTWDEIKQARYDLVPDNVTMAMLLPPKAQYVNMHPNCFHLHEVPEESIWATRRTRL